MLRCVQAGNFVREEILSAFIRLVAHTPELQAYTTSKLYVALQSDISQESLTLAATWVLGEYSDILLEGGVVDEEQPKQVGVTIHPTNSCIDIWSFQATDKDIVDLLISVMDSPYSNYLTRQFVVAAVTKISSRSTTSPAQQAHIAEILAKYTTSPELELQQRAVEFASLFALGDVRVGVLERMPPPELKATVMGVGQSLHYYSRSRVLILSTVSENKPVGSTKNQDVRHFFPALISFSYVVSFYQADLLGDEIPTAAGSASNGQGAATQNNQDLLAEIFGNSSSPSPSAKSPPAQSQKSTVDDILGLFGSSAPAATPVSTHAPPSDVLSAFSLPQTQSSPPPPPQATPRLTSYTAYEKNELKVTLTPQTSAARPGVVIILARFQTTGGSPVTGLNFQAAVPKVFPNPAVIKSNTEYVVVTTTADATYVKSGRKPWRC